MTIFNPILKRRLWAGACVAAVVLAGYYLRFYQGPLQAWVHRLSGGLLVVCFWSFLLRLFLPGLRSKSLAITICTFACVLELSLLVHHPMVTYLRGAFIGRSMVGPPFAASDLAAYLAGGLIAYAGLCWINR
ncbi:MAG: DUF2809 domain-containing protein [Desulfosarcinaceae bacterium]|nr:DUF2809 domain-containing protein [Desulfosarcinaceae bacterium]